MPGRRLASPRPRRSPASSSRCTCWRSTWARCAARLSEADRRRRIDDLLRLPSVARAGAEDVEADRGDRRALLQPHRLPLSRARHQLSDCARRRAQAQGDLVHPRRGLPGRRDEARADRAHRRADAGRGDRARGSRLREDARATSRKPRRACGSVIAITTEGDDTIPAAAGWQHRRDHRIPAISAELAPIADCDPAAASRLSHRDPPRLRRRSTAESREERHGRIDRQSGSRVRIPGSRRLSRVP